MYKSTRFSIAIPLRNIKVNTIIKALTNLFLHLWVFLKQFCQMRIQLYVSFISTMYASIKLNTKQFKSNESQGNLESIHQTLNKYDANILIRQSSMVSVDSQH